MKKYIKPNIKVVVLNEALAAPVTSDQTKDPGSSNAKDNAAEPVSTTVSGTSNSKGFWED
jgi:hypothetical protein